MEITFKFINNCKAVFERIELWIECAPKAVQEQMAEDWLRMVTSGAELTETVTTKDSLTINFTKEFLQLCVDYKILKEIPE